MGKATRRIPALRERDIRGYLVTIAEVSTAGAVGALSILGFPVHLPPLDLLAGHVATKAGLDLGRCRVGVGVVQGDVQDVLVQLRAGSLLLAVRGQLRGGGPCFAPCQELLNLVFC